MISYRSTMLLAMFTLTSMITVDVVHGCIPTNTDLTSNPDFYDSDGEYAEAWQGSVDFFDYWCGVPESSYRSDEPDGRRRRRRDISDDVDINTYSLDHSLIFFRGKCFEFGPGIDLLYVRGGVGRKAEGCPVTWTRFGKSRCTVKEVEDMAAVHQAEYGYHLLWNNCHHFTEWLLKKLLSDQCSIGTTKVPNDDVSANENKEEEEEEIVSQQGDDDTEDIENEEEEEDEDKNNNEHE